TSQPEYWDKVEKLVGGAPSTLNLIFPEVYLGKIDENKKIEKINSTMKKYLSGGILSAQKTGFVLIDRKTCKVASRKGLIMAVDLEMYDYSKGSQSLIRATEATVVDRLPPRIKIRENASVEIPHIMILIDDEEKTVIEPIAEKKACSEKLYDFELMLGGGHVRGCSITDAEDIESILGALSRLAEPSSFSKRYNVQNKGVLLFAVGDGNHSLAAAKGHWENVKKSLLPEEIETHPARFALVELVNVHDQGLEFEPIHRVVFNVDPEDLLEKMQKYFKNYSGVTLRYFNNPNQMNDEAKKLSNPGKAHLIRFVTSKSQGIIAVEQPKYNLEVGTLQSFLDDYLKSYSTCKIDYIHGDNTVIDLGSRDNSIGFLLPVMKKEDLFKTVILEGVLPRKTFSMGEAEEKRYYLECRKIVK
ncbi:MAG: DUF1015 family protein, partial [Bacillota bacterium]|nr:DUF1015 family protein [Bacillota bacterium]